MLKTPKNKFWYSQILSSRSKTQTAKFVPIFLSKNVKPVRTNIANDCCIKFYSSTKNVNLDVEQPKEITDQLFDVVCEETLESLTEFFEDLIDKHPKLSTADISYNNGVLTLNLGSCGTYVINRQSPNKQIWLSSPNSGPKRYDYLVNEDLWWYKHDGRSLHELLEAEISEILNENIKFSKCQHSKKI